MPTTVGSLPIFIRVGEGDEAEIGSIDILSQPDAQQGVLKLGIDKAGFATVLREAADAIDVLFPDAKP